MKLARSLVALLAAASVLPACAGGQAADPPAPDSARDSQQLLRPGDVVRLRIWREPDLSGEYQVQNSGTVVFPRLGEYVVIDETPMTLEARLLVDYRQYLRNPSIEVTVLRRVNVLGAVNRPGVYNVDPTVAISDVIAMAGGATPIGDPSDIRVMREGEVLTTQIDERTVIGNSPIRSGDQIYVPERSWIARNTGIVATLISAAATITVALFLR